MGLRARQNRPSGDLTERWGALALLLAVHPAAGVSVYDPVSGRLVSHRPGAGHVYVVETPSHLTQDFIPIGVGLDNILPPKLAAAAHLEHRVEGSRQQLDLTHESASLRGPFRLHVARQVEENGLLRLRVAFSLAATAPLVHDSLAVMAPPVAQEMRAMLAFGRDVCGGARVGAARPSGLPGRLWGILRRT